MSEVIDGVTYYVVRFLNERGSSEWGRAYVEYGGDATSQAPTPKVREGKVFTGWNHDITYITKDKTVWATYADACTVIFRNFANTGNLSEQVVGQGQAAVAPTPEIIQDMEFTGWDQDFSNVQGDMTIHPLYKTSLFQVRFLNFAETDLLSVQYVHDGESAVPPSPEKVPGYIFIGWSTSFSDVHEDKTIRQRFREIPPHPVLKFYKANADDTPGDFIKTYDGVNACTITQKLSGECTIDFTLMTRQLEGLVSVGDRLEVDGFVFNITEVKKQITGGVCYTQMTGEHVSYILNDEKYKVVAYDSVDPIRDQLQALLSGTPFSVGMVDFTEAVTLKVNTEVTRRSVIMQLIALVGGEIEYDGYTIGIRSHVGKTERNDVMKNANVQDISYTHNASEDNTNYSLSLYQKGKLELGDELILKFDPLGIDTESRIVGMDWNPFNYREVSITVGQYIPTLNDSLYELIATVEDITQRTSRYTLEFGEIIGNGVFYFTRSYNDLPYWQVETNDGSKAEIELIRKEGYEFNPFVGARLSGVNSDTETLVVFYLTVPSDEKEELDEQ